mmetsp:Transcript_36823/g.83335  ORF Transcript_36823/g.83335 Transcript_36823/m.83335 type:complete len:214 (+) Transcript_36823:184-825(+)
MSRDSMFYDNMLKIIEEFTDTAHDDLRKALDSLPDGHEATFANGKLWITVADGSDWTERKCRLNKARLPVDIKLNCGTMRCEIIKFVTSGSGEHSRDWDYEHNKGDGGWKAYVHCSLVDVVDAYTLAYYGGYRALLYRSFYLSNPAPAKENSQGEGDYEGDYDYLHYFKDYAIDFDAEFRLENHYVSPSNACERDYKYTTPVGLFEEELKILH